MAFKKNLIALLVIINILLICMLLVKRYREKFNDTQIAAIIDTANKNKIQINSNVKINSSNDYSDMKNAELFIDGDLEIGDNILASEPELCLGNNCFTSEKLKELIQYNMPYEVFETENLENNIPDKLCYDLEDESHCITGDDLKILNGSQPVYIAGPNDNYNDGNLKTNGHLITKIGPASHYYYDINDNYFEKEGMTHKQNIGSFTDPCNNGIICSTKKLYKAMQEKDIETINASGVTKVPYFYNLDKLNGVTEDMLNSINLDGNTKTCSSGEQGCNGDGILQMLKMPVHKQFGNGTHFNNDQSHVHYGNTFQDNELMNIAAVNLMPTGFQGSFDGKNVRDKIKYTLKPGDDTNLQCFSI